MVDVLTRICGSNISVSLATLVSIGNRYWSILCTLIVRDEVSPSSIIDPYSLASILIEIRLMSTSSKCTLKVWHIVSCVRKLILSTIKAKVFGHTIPFLIELVRLLASQIFEEIVTLLMATLTSNSLLDNLSTLSIHHAFMSHLLVSTA